MSYFVAKKISFNKKDKTFKVKGWDNNVIPVWNEWSNEMPLERLMYSFLSGAIQYRWYMDNKLMKTLYYIDIYSNKMLDYLKNILGDNISVNTSFFDNFDLNYIYKKWTGENIKISKEKQEEILEKMKSLNNEMINKILEKDPNENKKFYVQLKAKNWTYIHTYKWWMKIIWSPVKIKSFPYFTALHILKDTSNYDPILIEDID